MVPDVPVVEVVEVPVVPVPVSPSVSVVVSMAPVVTPLEPDDPLLSAAVLLPVVPAGGRQSP